MILLITSRHENQLTFPKGGIRNSETSRQAAIRETFEEAGCTGHLLGSFRPTYQKKNDDKNDIDTDNDNEENEGEEMDERKEILNYEWKEDNGKRGQDWQIIGDDSDGDDAERVATKWYPLLVEREYEDWPEKNQRNRYWYSLSNALKLNNLSKDAKILIETLNRTGHLKKEGKGNEINENK